MKNCPAPDADFKSWLKHQKSNWRAIRQDMKNEKKTLVNGARTAGSGARAGVLGNSSLNEFIRNMDDTVLNSTWHVLSVNATTYDPGILKVWAMTEQG